MVRSSGGTRLNILRLNLLEFFDYFFISFFLCSPRSFPALSHLLLTFAVAYPYLSQILIAIYDIRFIAQMVDQDVELVSTESISGPKVAMPVVSQLQEATYPRDWSLSMYQRPPPRDEHSALPSPFVFTPGLAAMTLRNAPYAEALDRWFRRYHSTSYAR